MRRTTVAQKTKMIKKGEEKMSYVDEVLDESPYDDDYAEMLYSNANEVKDALKGITSTGCVITNNELHILSVYPDNKPVMGFWDEYNDIEYVFGLKIYGA